MNAKTFKYVNQIIDAVAKSANENIDGFDVVCYCHPAESPTHIIFNFGIDDIVLTDNPDEAMERMYFQNVNDDNIIIFDILEWERGHSGE